MKKATLLIALAAFAAMGASAQQTRQDFVGENFKVDIEKAKLAPEQTLMTRADQNAQGRKATTKATVTADFENPKEVFTMGVSEDLGSFSVRLHHGPAYVPYTWVNTSIGATSYEWIYQDPAFESEEGLTTKETNLTATYPWASFAGPTLIASNEASSDTKTQSGVLNSSGTAYEIFPEMYLTGGESVYGNDDTQCGITTYDQMTYKDADGYGFSTGSIYKYDVVTTGFDANGVAAEWKEEFEEDYPGFKSLKLKSFGNIFPAPTQAYGATRAWAWMNVKANAATTLNVAVIRVEDNTITNDTIAYGTCNVAKGTTDVIAFDLLSKDADGFESADPVNINSSVLVVFYGFAGNPAIDFVAPIFGTGNTYSANEQSPYERHAVQQFEVETADGTVESSTVFGPWSYYTDETRTTLMAVSDYMVMLDAAFWWMDTESKSIALNKDGESKTFEVDAYGPSYSWYAETEVNGEDMSWLSFDYLDVTMGEQFTGIVQVTATAQALPAELQGRTANVKFSYPGAEMIVEFSQGTSGVEGVVTSATKVRTVNGNFEVTTDAKSVKIYSAAGALVKTANVEGNAVINAQDLAHGMYILKFDNNCTVKAVK